MSAGRVRNHGAAVEASKRRRDNPAVARTTPGSVEAGRDRHDVELPADSCISDIVGREGELAALHAFAGGVRQGPAACVLEGPAGIGKSTVWRAGVEYAQAHGVRVYSSRPAEAERNLAHVVLGDLFEDALDDVLPELQAPRRRALEVAFLRDETSNESVDHRALDVAVRDMLRLLSAGETIMIAVDDVQWLDASSAAALAFALRRLASNRVLVLLARRLADTSRVPPFERALAPERVQRLSVGPLSAGALHRVLRDRLGRSFARRTLLRIHEQSDGNPFFALELARTLDADVDPLAPLPVPETLEELVRSRISGLPASTRKALGLAAASGTTSESLLERAGVAREALERALAAGVVERTNGKIRFTHPLLSSVLYADLGKQRLAVHARLAGLVDDPLLRAHHLALSRDTPDAGIADALDEAARLAADRGAAATAAELAEQALRLTPLDGHEKRYRRALAAARSHQAAGEWTRARTIASDLVAETETGPLRAEALVVLAELESGDRAIALLEQALAEATARPALQSKIHGWLSYSTRYRDGYVRALQHARTALELADDVDDDALRIAALTHLAVLSCVVGDTEATTHAARAYDLAHVVGDAKLLTWAKDAVAAVLLAHMRIEEARAMLEREYREWRTRDELWSGWALGNLGFAELWGGRWELAADYAERGRDICVQYGVAVPTESAVVAFIAAHRGQLERARDEAQRAARVAEEEYGLQPPLLLAVLGLAALGSGDAPAAAEWLGKADRQAATLGWREPSQRPWSADYAEALLELGRIDDAVRIIDAWEADATRLGRAWVLAHVTRCRGLVAAARSDVGHALELLAQAVAEHDAVDDPFGRARALLALGTVRRRAREKRSAREAIEAAREGFETIGAASWSAKARAELGRISGRMRAEGLTAAELRVAALVVEGRTNREVAAALFLGERTVASHLNHIYAKLGVRSRTELALRLHPRGTP